MMLCLSSSSRSVIVFAVSSSSSSITLFLNIVSFLHVPSFFPYLINDRYSIALTVSTICVYFCYYDVLIAVVVASNILNSKPVNG